MRNAYELSVRDPEAVKVVGRPRCRWGNIKVVLKETVCECVDWIEMGQGIVYGWTVTKGVMDLWVV
jgi:hypothetical protein